MPDALSAQLQNIANYLCDCRQSRLAPASVDPEAHEMFCLFTIASQAVDVRARRTIPAEEWLGPAAMEIIHALAADSGIPVAPDAPLLTSCLFCPALIETRTGLNGVDDMVKAGWEAVSGGDWCCPSCAEARADLIGEER